MPKTEISTIRSADTEACPCCLMFAERAGDGQYSEYYCANCDHSWFMSRENSVTHYDYENSAKYEDYYIGRPPFIWYHNQARDYLLNNHKMARILDFGCYDGFFTKRLVDDGLNAYGCDWNRKALEHGSTVFGLGDRLSRNPQGDFDVIVALEVIEHFENPNDFLDIVLGSLNVPGVLIISCPNKNSVYQPKTDAPPHHFCRFSKRSLNTLLERRGLQIEKHIHEMSTFQLIRNVLGDLSRRSIPPLGEKHAAESGAVVMRRVKNFANSMSGVAALVTQPIDFALHRMGFAYLSQFVVARRCDAA